MPVTTPVTPSAKTRWLAACLWLLGSACSSPDTHRVGEVRVEAAWTRATPPGAPVAGGFATLRNAGAQPDRLVAVESSAAERVEIHEMREAEGLMKMRALPQGLPLPAKAIVELKPGSYHLMFIAPKRPFAEGDVVMATLRFERAGAVQVPFPVRAMGAGGHAH